MNIAKAPNRFIVIIALWLAVFILFSVLSGVAYSLEESDAKPAQTTTTAAPQSGKAPVTTPESVPDPLPTVEPTPYDDLVYSPDNAQYLIYLDAGHGWYDNGASVQLNENGEYDQNGEYVYEKDITLEITKKLKQALEKMGYTVGETRPGDEESDCPVSLVNGIFYAKNRPAYVNEKEADYFISIHCNSYGDSTVSGTRIFYSGYRDSTLRLAESIQQSLASNAGNDATLHMDSQLYILLYSTMPTVLIETGFMTNLDDLDKMRDPDWQDEFVCAVALGLDADVHAENG